MTEKLNLQMKLIEIRKSIGYIQKTEKGDKGNFYIDTSVFLKKIRDKMDELNVILIPSIVEHDVKTELSPTKNNKENRDYVCTMEMKYTWINGEEKDDILVVPWIATGKNINDPAQAFGSGLTYTERYFLLKFFQVPTGDDDPDKFDLKTEHEISEKETINLISIIESKGYSGKDINKIALRAFGAEKIENIKQSQYEEAINKLNDMPVKAIK